MNLPALLLRLFYLAVESEMRKTFFGKWGIFYTDLYYRIHQVSGIENFETADSIVILDVHYGCAVIDVCSISLSTTSPPGGR